MLSTASVLTAVIHIPLFMAGLVLAFMMWRDDRRAAMPAAFGFGCEIVAILIWVVVRMLVKLVVHSVFGPVATVDFAGMAITLGGRFFEIAGFVLIFVALLRRLRAARGPAEVRY